MTYGHLIASILVLTALFGFIVFLAFPPQQKVDVGGSAASAPSAAVYGPGKNQPSSGRAFYTAPQTAKIVYTDSGFSPAYLSIPAGTTVIFQNRSSASFWPASDPYPANTNYPEEGVCNGRAFDACGPLKIGEAWQFKFNRTGSWGYHDNLNPGRNGIITVR